MKKLLARLGRVAALVKVLYANRKAEAGLFAGLAALVSEIVRYLH